VNISITPPDRRTLNASVDDESLDLVEDGQYDERRACRGGSTVPA
jgi:hypothetical protein